jgi:hypothetical protein
MTPNLGQGGNQAIEGAAVLTNCLLEMLDCLKVESIELEVIEKTLLKYQRLRAKRAQKFIEVSGIITRDEAMATLRHTLKFLYMPLPSSDMIAGKCSASSCFREDWMLIENRYPGRDVFAGGVPRTFAVAATFECL